MTDSEAADPSFRYFPQDYRWSHGLLGALNSAPWGGAEIGEVNRVGLALRDHPGDDRAWVAAWADQADRLEAAGRARLAERLSGLSTGFFGPAPIIAARLDHRPPFCEG